MSRGAPVRQFAPSTPMKTVGVVCLHCALLAALMTAGGCATEKQEKFRQYNEEGVHRFQHGDYLGAREHFEVALTLEPQDPNLLYNLGQCWDRQGQTNQSETYYKQCLQFAANHAECRHALVVLLYRNGRRAEADRMIEDWLIAQPELSAAYAEDGWRLRRCGEFIQAIGRLQQALHFDPRNVRAMIELGQIYEEHDHPDYSLTMYRRALEINPQQPELAEHINQLRAKGVRKPLPD
jgi:Flp pilus assembly protein TadD